MKIIYNCYGGSHSSVTSAAIHLGLLNCEITPCAQELWKLPYYDTQVKKDHGTLHFMGTDELNHQVYVIGRRNMGNPVKRVLTGLAKVYGIPLDDFMLVDPMPYVNWAMKLGGITSRRLGLIPIGRPVVTWGTRMAFPQLVKLVEQVKSKLTPAVPVNFQPNDTKAVIYCDYNGRQQAAAAACLHLQQSLRERKIPKVPIGTPIYWGQDKQGCKIYSLGVSYENRLLGKIIREFANLYGIPKSNLTIVDLTNLGKVSFGVGALLQSLPWLRLTGEAWTRWFTQGRFKQLAQIVNRVKAGSQRPAVERIGSQG